MDVSSSSSAKLAYSVVESAAMSSVSRAYLYEQIKEGKLRTIKKGRRTLVLAEDLLKWLHD